jgi:hypothetical protein
MKEDMTMTAEEFQKVVDLVEALPELEKLRLHDMLEAWIEHPPGSPPPTEEEFEQEMLRKGILDHVPAPIEDTTEFDNYVPVEVEGKPVSETIIEERG